MTPDNLWAPWRLSYLKGLVEHDHADAPQSPVLKMSADQTNTESDRPVPSEPACFLCDAASLPAGKPPHEGAAERYVLLRDERGVLMLNRYPYTNGHLLVAGLGHVGELSEHTAEQRANLIELTALAERLLKTAVQCQGVNIGINQGRAAGAGVPGHLHIHILPRWAGDVNFITTVANARVIPQALDDSYELLLRVLGKMGEGPEN